ncbi:permease prefix domain 1-containing protein [Amphibacillus sp. Q70]|uniref:permease prefix domain 1-containing protein n=1 Tax=Amphibacillus sp. Q70 TaxID=3453416 RepID=UPI003F827CF7
MDTIMSYLETMFAKLPKTDELEQIKEELQMNMEEKYYELIAEGKTENEAIGTVISEFGNIDELIEELGYQLKEEESQEELQSISDQEIDHFFQESQRAGKLLAFGVSLIIFAVAVFMVTIKITSWISGATQFFDVVGLIPLFILVAIGVAILIVSHHRLEPFLSVIGYHQLTYSQEENLQADYAKFQPRYMRGLVIGVVLCILAPLALIIISTIDRSNGELGVAALLVLVSMAVYFFVYYGSQKTTYQKILKLDEYQQPQVNEKQEQDKIVQAVAAFIWPSAVVIFLISGLVFHQWHINWIIFPVTGLLFSGFAGMRYALKSK